MIKTCVVCGEAFEARGKVCSEPCRKEKRRRLSRECYKRRYEINGEKRRAEARRWKAKNRKRVREYQKQWLAKNKDRVRQSARAWRVKNRQRVLATKRAWESKNREKVRAAHKRASDAWRARNPNYNRDSYRQNAERRKEYSRQWKREAAAAYKLTCDLKRFGIVALSPGFRRPVKKQGKPRIRLRVRDPVAEKRHAAKRYAALKLIRELQSKGLEALL